MDITVTFDVGHAHVAAVRVLQYRNGRPPTIEEVAEVLGSKVELTNHRLRALERGGILTIVENPFEAHVSVGDHLALEKLPAEVDENALSEAVDDFKKRQAEKTEEQMRVFEETDEEREKLQKHDEMEKDLKAFRAKKTKKAPWEK